MFPWKIFTRLVFIQVVVVTISLVAVGLAARHYFEKISVQQSEEQLKDTLIALSAQLSKDRPGESCQLSEKTNLRLTLIFGDGRVACDTHHDPATMENHGSRPEVSKALINKFGIDVRRSETLQSRFIYVAYFDSKKEWILRGAVPLEDLDKALSEFDSSVGIFLFFVLALVFILAIWVGHALVLPIGELYLRLKTLLKGGDSLSRSLDTTSYGEWSEIETTLIQVSQKAKEKEDLLYQERNFHNTILSSIGEGILAVDEGGTHIYSNKKFGELFEGLTFQNTNVSLWTVVRIPEVTDSFRNVLNMASDISSSSHNSYFVYNGRTISLSVSPLVGRDHSIYGAVGIFYDLTQIKAASQMRVDFVENVSHEFKTPLTAIIGFSETLIEDLKENLSENVNGGKKEEKRINKEFVEAIHRNAKRLMALVTDLLELSKLDSKTHLNVQKISVRQLTEEVLQAFQNEMNQKKQVVTKKYLTDLVFADSQLLEQVLVNLLDNAIKYSPSEATIQIQWSETHSSTFLEISDNGPGIESEHHGRIFERFYRVDKGRSRDKGGTGLGLAIVKHIMIQHQGRISLRSSIDQGTTFTCEFPRQIS